MMKLKRFSFIHSSTSVSPYLQATFHPLLLIISILILVMNNSSYKNKVLSMNGEWKGTGEMFTHDA